MIKVCVTGGIGSGKSIVCRIFESLGVPVYYADLQSRRLVDSEPEIRNRLVSLFGPDIYSGNALNRPRFASVIFANRQLLEATNSIIHPYVRKDFNNWTRSYADYKYVIEEAAILFESGGNDLMDKCITVVSPEGMRINRVLQRPGMTVDRIREIMANQWSDEKKAALADYVIVNDEKSLVVPQVLSIHDHLTA